MEVRFVPQLPATLCRLRIGIGRCNAGRSDTLNTHDAANAILLKNFALANLHQDDFRSTAAT
jgi:hypothetical protein